MPPKGWKGHKQETGIKQGRPEIGITRKVSITLPEDTWIWLGDCIDYGHAKTYSELFRQIITDYRGDGDQ